MKKTPVNTEIASVNIKDDKTVIKKECDDAVNQAPAIKFPVFNTDSSQQSLARFIVENNLITLVPQQGAFIVNGQKGKYCVTLFPKETCQCVSTSKRKIDLSAIVEEENDTELPDILNVTEKIDDINSNKSLPVKKRKIENVTVENNEIEKHKNYSQQQRIGYCKIQHKHEILNKEYLCSDVIISAQNLLKMQFPDINGFQETTLDFN